MEIRIPEGLMRAFAPKAKTTVIKEAEFYGSYTIEHDLMVEADLKLLLAMSKTHEETRPQEMKQVRRLRRQLRLLLALADGESVTDLQLLPVAVERQMRKVPKGWLFVESRTTGDMNPYRVVHCTYTPGKRRSDYWEPAYVELELLGINRGTHTKREFLFHHEDLSAEGVEVMKLFREHAIYPANDELLEEYAADMKQYTALHGRVGVQLVSTGSAHTESSSSWRGMGAKVELDQHGSVTRLILDDDQNQGKDAMVVMEHRRAHDEDQQEASAEPGAIPLPVHPYLRCFNLSTHDFILVHVRQVGEYLYKRMLLDKVVMAEEVKSTIKALASSTDSDIDGDDIIEGKGKGVVLVMSGPAGVGKTLTAETYAEWNRKPLYSVQCAQLGVEPEKLEEELGMVLQRASKWNCILLLDEADVYIQARGRDIKQNALVGVFLRLLEYYRGVIFMNTNREDEIDEAILSRALLHLRYVLPTVDESRHLWLLMAKQFGVVVSEDMAKKLAERYTVSGRTIKQVMRVVAILHTREKKEVTSRLFEWVFALQRIKPKEGS